MSKDSAEEIAAERAAFEAWAKEEWTAAPPDAAWIGWQARSRLSAPDGWRLVPKEPTEAMQVAAVRAGVSAAPAPWFPAAYRAALATAPQPEPKQAGEVCKTCGGKRQYLHRTLERWFPCPDCTNRAPAEPDEFSKPQRKDGGEPCGECHLKPAEVCDICGAVDKRPGEPDERPCTCHPDDNPPRPCPRKYALGECRKAAEPDLKEAIIDELMSLVSDKPNSPYRRDSQHACGSYHGGTAQSNFEYLLYALRTCNTYDYPSIMKAAADRLEKIERGIRVLAQAKEGGK